MTILEWLTKYNNIARYDFEREQLIVEMKSGSTGGDSSLHKVTIQQRDRLQDIELGYIRVTDKGEIVQFTPSDYAPIKVATEAQRVLNG